MYFDNVDDIRVGMKWWWLIVIDGDDTDDDWLLILIWWSRFDVRYWLIICWSIYNTIDPTRWRYFSNYMRSTKNLMMHLDTRWQKDAHLSSLCLTIPTTTTTTTTALLVTSTMMINLSLLSTRLPHIVMWKLWVC